MLQIVYDEYFNNVNDAYNDIFDRIECFFMIIEIKMMKLLNI
jgi:hypothetical protein